MIVAHTIAETRRAVSEARRAGLSTVGLVPTMGALHAGHASLFDAAGKQCDFVAASIFVNPTQFGPGEDFQRYPRTPRSDLALCEQQGVQLVFMPSAEEMYGPDGSLTTVSVARLSETLCGKSRPGHFTGVCTVVMKLFQIVQPDRAYFGEKDYQQLTVLRRMTADLNVPVEIVACPTVREADGLALSSRNAYLSPAQRQQAPALYAALREARELVQQRHPPAAEVIDAIRNYLDRHAPLGEIDYVQLVDPDTLRDVSDTNRPVQAALAVRFGSARLIDNLRLA